MSRSTNNLALLGALVIGSRSRDDKQYPKPLRKLLRKAEREVTRKLSNDQWEIWDKSQWPEAVFVMPGEELTAVEEDDE